MLLRVDENDITTRVSNKIISKITNNTYEDFKFDGLIISDYCKGFLTESDIQYLIEHNNNVFLDTKKILGEWMYDVDFVKINEKEYEKTKRHVDERELVEKLIITRGSEGCQYQNKVYSVPQVDGVKDYSGAGDTFLSGFAHRYMETKNITSAINYAQECATIVVQKHGVATI
jgi:bifunctional ADP-heptose synthase (sugar kinase/adenylyltransferase)